MESTKQTAHASDRTASSAHPDGAPLVRADSGQVRVIPCRSVKMLAGHGVEPLAIAGMVGSACVFLVAISRVILVEGAGTPWTMLALASTLTAFGLVVLLRSREASDWLLELVDGGVMFQPNADSPRRSRLVNAERVESGYAVTPSRLVLWLRSGGKIEAQLDAGRAEDVLDHLGMGLEQHTVSVPLGDTFDTTELVIGTLLGAFGFCYVAGRALDAFRGSLGIGVCGVLAIICAVAVATLVRPRLVAGLDGVHILAARSAYVPYSSIKGVRRSGPRTHRIVLETSSGLVRLSCSESSAEEVAAVVKRIEQGRTAATATQAARLDLLDRRGRTLHEWRAALRDLAMAGRGFRGAALSEDDLTDVLADPEAPLERRVAAALALRSRSSDARERIRVAAATTAEPRVRVALEAAAADAINDHAIDRALAKAEPPRAVAVHDPHDPRA